MTSPTPTPPRRYRFADLALDVGQRRVWRGTERLALTDLSFELLRVLVESWPNVVEHDELAAKAWGPRRTVTPENLAKRVMLLRQALGDHADHSRYIEGVRGRGYRLLPDVQASAEAHVEPTSQNVGDSANESSSARANETFGATNLRARESPAPRRGVYVAAGLLALAAVLAILDDLRVRDAAGVSDALGVERGAASPFSFIISAPKGSTFGAAPAQPNPELDPTGRRLAFVAPVRSQNMLWIQTLGELDAKVLAGTEGAQAPFWSPDGRFVAFQAGGQITRIAADGQGAPRDVVNVGGPRQAYGGAWAPDGTIVFSADDGIYRVPTNGEPAQLTKLDHSRGEFSHRFPVLLPDGRRLVYLVLSSQTANQGLFLASLDDPQLHTRLVASTSNAAIGSGPDGRPHLLYLNDADALVAQPFDASLERLTGEPIVIAPESVRPCPSVRAAAFTASGRTLVYRPRFSPASRLVWFDRKGTRIATVSPAEHSYRFPALSVDGTKLAAMRDDDFDTRGVWWLDLRHGVPERLTRGGESMSAWAPDGEHIIYSTPLPEGWTLHRRAIGGSDEAQLLLDGPVPVLKRIRDVTEDFLVFAGSDDDLWLLPLSGDRAARPLMQTPERENHARVSPNGRWLAYSSSDANETRVYVTAFPTPAERWLVSPAGGSDPRWRDDGRELYYVGPDDALIAVEVDTDAKFSVGAQTPLFDARFDPQSRAFSSAYAPAPRGERFLVAELAANAEAYLVVTQNWAPFEAGASR